MEREERLHASRVSQLFYKRTQLLQCDAPPWRSHPSRSHPRQLRRQGIGRPPRRRASVAPSLSRARRARRQLLICFMSAG